MPSDLWLVFGFLGFAVAASLVAFGVWKLDMRLLAAGAVIAGFSWLSVAFTTPDEWASRQFVTLRLRPVDAIRREMISSAVVNGIEPTEAGPATCRLPVRLEAGPDENVQALAVSLVVEMRLHGSLLEQYREPAAHTHVIEQILEVRAPGYRPWRGTLTKLLPRGWPIETAASPTLIEMQPE